MTTDLPRPALKSSAPNTGAALKHERELTKKLRVELENEWAVNQRQALEIETLQFRNRDLAAKNAKLSERLALVDPKADEALGGVSSLVRALAVQKENPVRADDTGLVGSPSPQ